MEELEAAASGEPGPVEIASRSFKYPWATVDQGQETFGIIEGERCDALVGKEVNEIGFKIG